MSSDDSEIVTVTRHYSFKVTVTVIDSESRVTTSVEVRVIIGLRGLTGRVIHSQKKASVPSNALLPLPTNYRTGKEEAIVAASAAPAKPPYPPSSS
jgi:hypothetical protein